ncbi:hypothetical protein KBC51_02380 [Candidatus Saccharibacteria bacterium]|nr:hypothetical protein [Candidatus Saccharibacteria bacterium]
MSRKNVYGLMVLAILVVGAGWFWTNKYEVYDYFALKNYTPSPQVASLASSSGMNTKGQKIFYVNDPRLSDRQEFSTECSNNKEQTIVLGCYTGRNIYIFDVTDSRLNGVEEVTSAHEMLHAAYDRLSASERARVDKLTDEAFQRINNPRITSLIENYRSQDPSVVPNELHSILGTEVANLGPELEAYYSKYFADRSKVIAHSQAYEKVLADSKNQVEKLDADLTLRRAEIERLEIQLNGLSSQLEAMQKNMNSLSAGGNVARYNALVPQYNAQVNQYNILYNEYSSLLAQYNKIVEQRNSLAIEQQDLVKSLDSRVKSL